MEKKLYLVENWKRILNELVEICFDIIPIVTRVVNSSSPEGHLPMDFQTSFENLLKIDSCKGAFFDCARVTGFNYKFSIFFFTF